MRSFIGVTAILFSVFFYSQASAAVKKPASYFRLVEAFSQKTIVAQPDAVANIEYHFIIVWGSDKFADAFFWRGENGWLTCNVEKTRKVVKKIKGKAVIVSYASENIATDNIHKGDTLQLTPMKGGKFRIPAEIPVSAKNRLYYQMNGGGWKYCRVKNIVKKPDIIVHE